MTSLGFRCNPNGFCYVILDGNQVKPVLITHDSISLPSRLGWSEKLHWVKRQVSEILQSSEIDKVSIKSVEPNVRRFNTKRSEIEGVIKETVFSIFEIECNGKIKNQIKKCIGNYDGPPRYLNQHIDTFRFEGLHTTNLLDAASVSLSELPEA